MDRLERRPKRQRRLTATHVTCGDVGIIEMGPDFWSSFEADGAATASGGVVDGPWWPAAPGDDVGRRCGVRRRGRGGADRWVGW
ncbi:hypothetical protein MOPEL_067_00710 [Mobilicoccus pelagius NBRC 104925]|uniref:Uncharacterized protein n=1 Tax=Mobilicoccus pelagius NBRC 104925 TaxID=1089455 RepID=H5UR64_9MICO|nr:hypothetical protein MOPEL_067_00710 [Mobilicoccus pelagius NBRC 104925]